MYKTSAENICTFDIKPALTNGVRLQNKTGVNIHGDAYKKNQFGQVNSFLYGHSGITFTFTYDAEGHVCDIESSNAWVWKRIKSQDFDGWLVRNCFDRWYVNSNDCCDVFVGDHGVNAVGNNIAMMMLPERP